MTKTNTLNSPAVQSLIVLAVIRSDQTLQQDGLIGVVSRKREHFNWSTCEKGY